MQVSFRKAVKHGAKLRLAICGPSGSGKTYTLLNVATELGGPIALVDTERGSASKYADIFQFDVLELESYDPRQLSDIIDYTAANGYAALCIDSLSHFWMGKDGELDLVDRIAKRSGSNNSFAAWRHVTPLHNALIDKITAAPIHVLASLRVKTEWVVERDEKTGKTAPRKVGLAPVMRDGIEYEFDICGEMDQENTLIVTKSRCPRLSGAVFGKPGKEFVDVIKEWLTIPEAPAERSQEVEAVTATVEVVPEKQEKQEPEAIAVEEDLGAVWKRMCSRRGIEAEFERLQMLMAGAVGADWRSAYGRILEEHGVTNPSEFRTTQAARLCAKQILQFLEPYIPPRKNGQREIQAIGEVQYAG